MGAKKQATPPKVTSPRPMPSPAMTERTSTPSPSSPIGRRKLNYSNYLGSRSIDLPTDEELRNTPADALRHCQTSLGFAVFFSTPTEVFPGLNREGLLRPPSIMPPSVPNRSADTFTEILHLLRGYPLHIKNEDHRAELLRDCRYFHLKGLEQKLIRHSISFNLARSRHEITLRLEDVRQSGISVLSENTSPPPPDLSSTSTPSYASPPPVAGWVNYARPFVDDRAYELVLEIGDECTRLHLSSMRCEFFGDGKTRVSRLFEVIATKLNLPTSQPLGLLMMKGGASSQPASPGNTPISEDWVRCVLGEESWVRLDGKEWRGQGGEEESGENSVAGDEFGEGSAARPRKRRRTDISGGEREESWIVKTGQWRLKVQNAREWECEGWD